MEHSKNKKSGVSDELIKHIFPDFKDATNKITENKYFNLKQRTKFWQEGPVKNKNQITREAWFESLDINDRVLAVSTIFTNNTEVLEHIKKEVNECMNESFDFERQEYCRIFNSNADLLNGDKPQMNGYLSNFGDINTISQPFGYISRYLTYIDTNTPDDTLTVQKEIVENADGFFEILGQNTVNTKPCKESIILKQNNDFKNLNYKFEFCNYTIHYL